MTTAMLQFRTKATGDRNGHADNARNGIVCIRFPPVPKTEDDLSNYLSSPDYPLPPAA
jgi:hypothetical protein